MENIRLLILGTGGMARNHAEGFGQIPGVQSTETSIYLNLYKQTYQWGTR